MAELTGTESARLREALVDAFSSVDMQLFIQDNFNKNFLNIAPIGLEATYEFRVYRLVEFFRERDELTDLVAAARARRPKNAAIATIAEKLGLTVTGPRYDTAPDEVPKPLEEIVQRYAKLINPSTFRERLGALEGRVCWIRIPGGGGGTGFLVGPDLVVSNYHVMKRVKENPGLAPGVRLSFDFKQTTDGQAVLRTKVVDCLLAQTDWWIDGQPPSSKDWDAALGDAGMDELDYVLLRLDSRIGDDPVGGVTADLAAEPRGWIDPSAIGIAPAVGEQIFLLQHPEGEPLRLSVGTITEYNGNKSRIRYNANSKDGSSGSPCFNADLQLVALHHAHDTQRPPRWNQAVPFEAITAQWNFP